MISHTDRQKLIGSWRLDSWMIRYPDTDKVSHPFGSHPEGLIIYSEAGWMSAAICRRDRDLFAQQQSLRSLPAAALAQAYKSYFHYAGPFRVEGEKVIHTVAMSLNPNFVGTEQVRNFTFDRDLLTLSGTESFDHSTNTEPRCHRLQWQRITAP